MLNNKLDLLFKKKYQKIQVWRQKWSSWVWLI